MTEYARRVIATIGARDTPAHILEIMEEVGYSLAKMGRMIHSGGAVGADKAFQIGVERFCRENGISPCERQRIFLPENYFKGLKHDEKRGIYSFPRSTRYSEAVSMAKRVYLNPKAARNWPEWMSNLMGRNCLQALSEDLSTPVSAIICWTKDGSIDGSKKSSGGTGQALRLAKKFNIPVFNLANEHQLEFVKKHIIEKAKNIDQELLLHNN